MRLMLTAKGSTNAARQLISREHSIRFNHPPFAMRPNGFNRVEPGALDWQATGQDTHPVTFAFHLAIMFPDPAAHLFAYVPGGIIPYQCQDTFAHRFQLCAAPFKKLNRDIANRTSIHETQQDLLVGLSVLLFPPQQQAVTSQCLGFWVVFGLHLFNQTQWLILFGPGRQVGLSKTAPPGLITVALDPIPIRVAPTDQSITTVFSRSYAGSGLVIQCLARFHFTPRR